jgi:hypothetical protein
VQHSLQENSCLPASCAGDTSHVIVHMYSAVGAGRVSLTRTQMTRLPDTVAVLQLPFSPSAPAEPHPPGAVLYRSPARWPGRVSLSRGGGAAAAGAGGEHDQAQALKLLYKGARVQVQPLHYQRLATAQRLRRSGGERVEQVQASVHRLAVPACATLLIVFATLLMHEAATSIWLQQAQHQATSMASVTQPQQQAQGRHGRCYTQECPPQTVP